MYATIFLVPVFFLPFTFNILEFNKLYLLFFLVWLSVLVWFLKMIVRDKEFKIRYSKVDYALLAFIGVAILSSIFSADRISSIFGYYGRFSTGLVVLLSSAAFYFLIANNLGFRAEQEKGKTRKKAKIDRFGRQEGVVTIEGIIKTLLCSGFVVMLFAYFSLFGVWVKMAQSKDLLPIVRNLGLRVSPAGGTVQAMAMFLLPLLILSVLMVLGGLQWGGFGAKAPTKKSRKRDKTWKLLSYVFIILSIVLLIVTDSTAVWVILSLGLLALVIMALRKRVLKNDVHKLILPIALIIISVLFMFISFWSLYNLYTSMTGNYTNFDRNYSNFMLSRNLRQGESWSIALSTTFSRFKNVGIGSGLGTFYYDFSRFRPDSMNLGDLWSVRFDRSGGAISETLATMGILGLASFLVLLANFFLMPFGRAVRFKIRRRKRQNRVRVHGKRISQGTALLLIIMAVLFLIQFSFYQTITLALLFWLFLGVGIGWIALGQRQGEQGFVKVKSFRLKDFVEVALVLETVLIVFFISFVVFCFFGMKFYLADVKYVDALNKTDLDAKAQDLQKAIRLNPRQIRYQMVLSKIFLVKAQEGLANLEQGGDQQAIIENIRLARLFAMNATEVTPQQIIAWQSLAELYQNTMAIAQESEQFAQLTIDALKRAVELEPKNPQFYTEIGNMYLLLGRKDEARAEFEKAIDKKANYAPANINIALLLEQDGLVDEAIRKLETLQARNANNVEILFQLGRLYYNVVETDKAIAQFIAALKINPNYSNALYSLGIAYEKQDRKQDAIIAFEAVLELNPGLEAVQDKIDELKGKRQAPAVETEEGE